MTLYLRCVAACLVFVLGAYPIAGMAIDEAPYRVVDADGRFELRDYAPYVVAETLVEGDFESVGNEGFRRLFRYIGGANRGSRSIAMTAPVEQAAAPQEIAMTAPVEQTRSGERWRVAFVLPAEFTLDRAPLPDDPRIALVQMTGRRMAAVRYSGTWSETTYAKHLAALRAWVAARGLAVTGEPVWARYNPPMMPWFLRRNEIILPVAGG